MSQRLPFDYNVRLDNLHFIDAPANTVHQHQVYEFLRYLVQRGGFRRVIDIGCGSAEKLKDLDETVEVTCVDAAPIREFVARNMPRAEFIEWDLDDGLPELGCYVRNAIVVCADVIEPCLSDWLTFAGFPIRLLPWLLSCLIRRREIFIILAEHAFVFRKGFAHTD